MGFKLPKRTALIEWADDHEYHGLEVRLILDAPMELLFLFQAIATNSAETELSIRTFGDRVLKEWNLLDDDGEPVPATGEGILKQPFALAAELVAKWTEATTQPSAPLGVQSPNGSTSLEASIPMAVSSGSQPN